MDVLGWNKSNNQRHLFETESNNINCFIKDEMQDIVWIESSGTLMAVKRSILRMFNVSIILKKFEDPLRAQKDNTTSVKKCSCEDVA